MKEKIVYNGSSIFVILTIVFIVLKLVGTIDWSWWWVLSPLLIEFVLIILTVIIVIPLYIILINKYDWN